MNIYKATDLIQKLPLPFAILVYVYCRIKLDGRKYDSWQIFDFILMIEYRRICLNRARGGSKTCDTADFAVFLALRQNEVFWIAATNRQLKMCKKYWRSNSFVIPFNPNSNRTYAYTINFGELEFVCATDGNIRGPRKNVIIYDEMAMIKWSLYENSLPIFNGMSGVGDGIFQIMISTPVLGSTFHKCCDVYPTITRKWYWMSWFTLEDIRNLKKILRDSKFKQEVECIFTALEGVCFENNIFRGACPYPLEDKIYYGFDPNPREGYTLVGVKYAVGHKAVQVVFVKNFGTGNAGKKAILKYMAKEKIRLRYNCSIEIETNGPGMPIYDEFVEDYPETIGMFWKDEDKIEIVNELDSYEMYFNLDQKFVNDRTKMWFRQTHDQVANLMWSEDGNKIDKPPQMQWHFNDCFLHACHKDNFIGVEA